MADNLNSIFPGGEQIAAPVNSADDAAKKQALNEMKKEMKDAMASSLQDPSFKEKLHTLSGSLEVTKCLGYGDNGNIKLENAGVKKADGSVEGRKVAPTSAIVGYLIKNIGSTPISYQTEKFSKGADGIYVGQVVQETLAPGAEVAISRKYLAVLTAQPEYSFTLNNGKIVSPKRKFNSLSENLSAHYFKFDDPSLKVNDDSMKIRIDKDKIVLPEYEAIFGNLNNPKSAGRKAKTPGEKFSTQDYASNFINKLIQAQGIN